MGSGDIRFNVSLDEVTRQCPQITTFEERGERKRNRTKVRLTCLTPCLTARPNHLTILGDCHLGGFDFPYICCELGESYFKRSMLRVVLSLVVPTDDRYCFPLLMQETRLSISGIYYIDWIHKVG